MRSPRPGVTQAGVHCVEKGKTEEAGKRLLLASCLWRQTAVLRQLMPIGYVATAVSEIAADLADSPNPAQGVVHEELGASDVLCQHGIRRMPCLCANARRRHPRHGRARGKPSSQTVP